MSTISQFLEKFYKMYFNIVKYFTPAKDEKISRVIW